MICTSQTMNGVLGKAGLSKTSKRPGGGGFALDHTTRPNRESRIEVGVANGTSARPTKIPS
jgi:hypothetical protein